MTSLLCHFSLQTSKNLHIESSYMVLLLCKIWFCLRKGKRSYERVGGGGGEGWNPP